MKEEPQACVLNFLRWLRKKQKVPLEKLSFLDLGCGTGRNANYLADLDGTNTAVGIDFSETAITLARERAQKLFGKENQDATTRAKYFKQSIAEKYPLADGSVDIAIDITSSNSLSGKERQFYVTETSRVLKPGGYFLVRALCKDGDQNAKNLLKLSHGPEKDTYFMSQLGLYERVFTKEDFIATYSPSFKILKLEKETHYPRVEGRLYKRNFWIAYLGKK
jgi:SAM-dependent methyltransferase